MPSHGPITDEEPHTRVRLPADPYASGTERKSRWASGIAALAVIALVIAAVAVTNRSVSDPSEDEPSSGGPVPASGQAPSERRVQGVAIGHPHTQAGAESAATNYAVALGSAAMVVDSTRHKIVRAVADPAVEPALQARLDAAFKALRKSYDLDRQGRANPGLKFVYRTLPVGAHLVAYSADAATIEVWTNGISGLAGRSSTKPVVEAWHTITVTLRWVDGDWRWVAFKQRAGPTPVSGVQPVSGADEIAKAVERFGGFSYGR